MKTPEQRAWVKKIWAEFSARCRLQWREYERLRRTNPESDIELVIRLREDTGGR